jgi:hypothetical protein
MKVSRLTLCAVILLSSSCGFADSVTFLKNLSVNLSVQPNAGFGDNVNGTIFGNGVNLSVGGGTPFEWYGTDGYAPGSVGGGSTDVFFDFVFGTIGKKFFDDGINEAHFDTGSFMFPTNGRNFTITLPASFGVIVLTGCTDGGGCYEYDLATRQGTLTMSFQYQNGLYYAGDGSFVTSTTAVPEPATLSLLTLGLAALPWQLRRRMKYLRRTQSS